MKLGFTLRKFVIDALDIARRLLDMGIYLLWLLVDPSKFKIIDNKKIKNMLVVDVGAIGDTYNVLGIINELIFRYPYLNINYLGLEKNKKFIKNPKINVINKQEVKSLIDKKKLDAIIFLTTSHNPELFDRELYFKSLKVPYRVFSDYSRISNLLDQIPFFITRRVFPTYKTMLGDSISAFETLGFSLNNKIRFHYTAEAEKFAEKFMNKIRDNKKQKIIFIHPSNEKVTHALKENKVPSSDWANEKWVRVIEQLMHDFDSKFIFTGSKDESPIIEEIISKIKNKKRTINAAGKFSLEELASLLKRADLLISVDTSIAHFGAQVGIPLIVLMFCKSSFCGAPTNFKIDIFHAEVCNNCQRYACAEGNNICMKAITVKEVLDAANSFLKK